VASKSIVMSPGVLRHTTSRAPATALDLAQLERCRAFTALQAVEIDATSPNSSEPDRSVSKSLSSRPVRDGDGEVSEHTPGRGVPRDATVGHRHDMALVNPVRSASSHSNACRVRDEIAAVVLPRPGGRAATMHLQGGLSGWLTVFEHSHSPAEEAFYAILQPHAAIA